MRYTIDPEVDRQALEASRAAIARQRSVRERHLGAGDFTGTAEDLARLFHETCERQSDRLFPERAAPHRPWEGLGEANRRLLIAAFEELLFGEKAAAEQPDTLAVAEEREG